MRQRADSDKIKDLLDYHCELKKLFKKGQLEGKIIEYLKNKAKEEGVSLTTFWRRKKNVS